jgi:hypothetical protein
VEQVLASRHVVIKLPLKKTPAAASLRSSNAACHAICSELCRQQQRLHAAALQLQLSLARR